MASLPRNFNPNSYYHIYNRAIPERRKIFLSERDYRRFLNTIIYYLRKKQSLRYSEFERLSAVAKLQHDTLTQSHPKGVRAKILAATVMPNHFHFLLKPDTEDPRTVGYFIADISNSYTRYFNRKYKRTGALFESTFKAKEAQDEESVLQLTRYIHLNPVLSSKANPAGKLKKPEEYPYSSYPEWIGLREPYLVDKEELDLWHSRFGGPKSYQEFVEAQLERPSWVGIENLILE